MSSYVGISPKGPRDYVGPNVYYPSVVTRHRRPTGADYRQPETGKLYVIGGYWLVGSDPTTGVQGELWYLSKIVANVGYWNMVSASSSGPLQSVMVQENTSPGVNPVLPDGAGLMTVNGASVAAHSVPIETRSRALNEFNVEIQYASSAATTDATQSGIAHFNSSQFSVDANGFVELTGGGAAIDSIQVDASTPPGTNPVDPSVTGLVTVTGAQVATGIIGANVIRTNSLAANSLTIQIQQSTISAAEDTTKNGVAHFKTADFGVSNGFVTSKNSGLPSGVTNLGMTFTASTFSVTSANASALSASNIAYVTFPSSTTPGTLVTIGVTANQTFVDHTGASTIDGNLFGFTAGDVQSSDVPFFLYAVLNSAAGSPETAVSFMICREAGRTLSPIAGSIGKTGSSIADDDFSFFALSNPTVADYASSPCMMIGSFRMTKVATADGWNVTTLTSQDGIGRFQQDFIFNLTAGVMGSKAGSHWINNGGTAPTFDSTHYDYMIQPSGWINVSLTGLAPTVNGVGAVIARIITPLRNKITSNFPIQTGGNLVTGTVYSTLLPIPNHASYYAEMYYVNEAASGPLINTDLGATVTQVAINLFYYPRTS